MMNILTGRAKQDFTQWYKSYAINYNEEETQFIRPTDFDKLKFEMQSGVLTRFFDEKGIYIDRRTYKGDFEIWDYRNSEPEDPIIIDVDYGESQEENLKEAFEAANNIYNV